MQVKVRLFANLKDYLPGGKEEEVLELPVGANMGDLLEALGISKELEKIVLVNGVHRKDDYVLKDGDSVAIFPPVEGG